MAPKNVHYYYYYYVQMWYVAVVAYQFDRDVQGRITYNAGFPSSVQTALIYSNQDHHASLTVQVQVVCVRVGWCACVCVCCVMSVSVSDSEHVVIFT